MELANFGAKHLKRSRDRAKVQPMACSFHISVHRRGDLLDRSSKVERQYLGVGKGENRLEVERDILGEHAPVGDLHDVVLGMPGDIATASPDTMPTAFFDLDEIGRAHV